MFFQTLLKTVSNLHKLYDLSLSTSTDLQPELLRLALTVHQLDLCAESLQLLLEVLIATLDVDDVADRRDAICGEAGDDEGGTCA